MPSTNSAIDTQTGPIQTWRVLMQQTENIVRLVQENADKMCARTLEKLVRLIADKNATHKLYSSERARLESEYNKTKEEVKIMRTEYQKLVAKWAQDKAKYEDMCTKFGKFGGRVDDSRTRYRRTTAKLHKVHNDYTSALSDANIHQKQFHGITLPCLLDFHQDTQENLVTQTKEILQEYAQLTDKSTPEFSECYSEIHKAVNGLHASSEYDNFLEKDKSEPLAEEKFEFDASLLNDYKGQLLCNEIVLDDITIDNIQHRLTTLESEIESCVQEQSAKRSELEAVDVELSKMPPANDMDEVTRNQYNSKRRTSQVLKRELTEIRCREDRLNALYLLLKEPVTKLGTANPPQVFEDETSDGDAVTSSNSTMSHATRIRDRIYSLKSTISQRNPFKRHSLHPPPTLPSRDFLDQSPDNYTLCDQSQLTRPTEAPPAPKAGGTVAPSGNDQAAGEPTDNCQEQNNCTDESNESEKKLEEEDWFHGVMPREEVQRLLVDNGDYLVREGKNRKTGETQYVLSVMWNGHKHFIIQGTQGKWRLEGDVFPTVQELVLHQHESGVAVTKKSEVVLKKAIRREEWELSNNDVTLGQKIGNGNFGDVFRGIYKPTGGEVAIKTCRETLSEEAKKKFLQEGRILKQYNHPNIVRFIGIAAQRQPVMIIMEYVHGGALLTFLRKRGSKQTKKQLVKMSEDASAGMAYLEDNGCIHRDLAARNCLVSKENTVKISDFGMSREEEEYTVSRGMKQIPIKWTAPEALNYGTYTSASDVWSFGILMWEVFSFGATPYPGYTNAKAKEEVDQGYRMPAPDGTPDACYSLMVKCWEYEPRDRPHFDVIYRELQQIRTSL
ncbi:hypothetical protein NP493_1060g01042 [Ridgeia piscesae]|uniref:Tyrosine-protein kinase n=1 Tax=Ridgeia piscesae TaxID=27915 RepID=A0AAD9KIP2_RIDPI|nr:hypothetical protein NP493_1060g01042 [Ridgeia piscesae]